MRGIYGRFDSKIRTADSIRDSIRTQKKTIRRSLKFRPKMRQNAFGGRAPPGPAGELERSPHPGISVILMSD